MVVTVGLKNKECGWNDLIVLIEYFVWLTGNWTSIIQYIYSWPWTAHAGFADPPLCISAANGYLVQKLSMFQGIFVST